MLSLLLITALAVQYPPPASKPATQDTATTPKRTATAPRATAPRATAGGPAVSRMVFHDRMRALWSDHVTYTRNFILSATASQGDTAEVLQRLLRNQDEIGDAIKPYYGDAASTQLASLLRNHIQLFGKTLVAAKGTSTAMQPGMNMQDNANQYQSSRMPSDTVSSRTDTTKIKSNSQYPTATGRMADTAKSRSDTAKSKTNARVTGDTISARLPSGQYGNVRTDSTQNRTYAQGQMTVQGQATTTVDTTSLNQAIADLKANGDSIAAFLASANPRGFSRETLSGAIQMHLTLLLKEMTAQIKKDYAGSVAAFDESMQQAAQMADMLSDGIMKQFPSRFSNRTTNVSLR